MSETKKPPFTQIPNTVQNYLATADMNMTQFRIFNAVARYTYGYHVEWRWLSLSALAKLTSCNQRQIERELKIMLDKKILNAQGSRMRRELQINESVCSRPDPILKQTTDSLDGTDTDSLDGSGSDSSDGYIKKGIKESSKESNKHNTSIYQSTEYYLKEYDSPIKEYIDTALQLYYKCYRERIGNEHPKLKKEQLERVYSVLSEYDNVEDMIENFFETMNQDNTDFNLNHFATEGMLQILSERVK